MEPQGTPNPSEQPNFNPEAPKPADNAIGISEAGAVENHAAVSSVTPLVQAVAQPVVDVAQLSVQPALPQSRAVSGEDVVSPDTTAPTPPATSDVLASVSPTSQRKRWLLPTMLVVVALLLMGGYVFAFYLPNQPSAIYSASLQRTGKALDSLIAYSKTQAQKNYRSYDLDGKLTVTASGTSFGAVISGSMDAAANATATLSADVLGEHVSTDVRSLHVANSTTPDVYIRVSGIKPALNALGMSQLSGLDGQWVALDHALLDSYATNYDRALPTTATSFPTAAQTRDALSKAQAINKQYLFTADSSHAVLQNKKYVGKETKDGRSVYHYAVGYNKAHLKAYVDALSRALDSSALNSWAKSANDGKSLSEVFDVASLKDAITSANPGYAFDVWIDAKTKLVQSVTFTDPKRPAATFTLGQNYTGGSSYPFTLSFQDKADDGTTESGSLKLMIDSVSNKETGTLAFNALGAKVDLSFSVTPSTKDVHVTAPVGAQSANDILSGLILSGL